MDKAICAIMGDYKTSYRSYDHPMEGVRVSMTGGQAITTGTLTPIDFTSEVYDTHDLFNGGVSASRITFKRRGFATIGAWAQFANPGATIAEGVSIYLNGTSILAAQYGIDISGGGFIHNVTANYLVAKGDYVDLRVIHTRGSNLNVSAAQLFALQFPEP